MSVTALRHTDVIVKARQADERIEPAHGLGITVQHLHKSFGDNHVLCGINLHIRPGEFVAIVGRSGCGKSTLLRLLIGLDRPSQGTFWFEEGAQRIDNPGALRVMFQEPRLLPWASVLSNVEVGLGSKRTSQDARERARATLQAVDLDKKRDEWPAALSGGQKQRVALARALVSHPRVMALDEPFGALDALTRITMQDLLERMWHEQGFTALLVTHDVAEAVTIADRVLMIEEGEVALDLRVDLPRPRERGSAGVAALEGQILRALFRNAHEMRQSA